MPIPRPRTIRDPPEIRSTCCLDAAYSGTRHYIVERALKKAILIFYTMSAEIIHSGLVALLKTA